MIAAIFAHDLQALFQIALHGGQAWDHADEADWSRQAGNTARLHNNNELGSIGARSPP